MTTTNTTTCKREDEVTEWRKLQREELRNLYSSPDVRNYTKLSANSRSASQEIPLLFCNPKVHYRVHKRENYKERSFIICTSSPDIHN